MICNGDCYHDEALPATGYDRPGLLMVDLDLLCRQADLAALAESAMALGFRAVGENSTYHLAFQHPGLGAGLEFHFDLYEALAERREFVEEVFAEAEILEGMRLSFFDDLTVPVEEIPEPQQRQVSMFEDE